MSLTRRQLYTRAAPNTTSLRAEPCTSPPPVGARARPSAHRRCLSGLNGAPADNAPCETFWEPKTVDPHPINATHPAQAAPRSVAACRRTAAGSDRNFHFELPLHPKSYASYPVVSTANSSGLFEVVVRHILAVLRSRCAGFACPACLAADTYPARPLLST